ncbi:thiosulfate oxidation carrier protein SoxY [Undibacterium terreum]|uniref:Thiosulfate oxidation carrier protein SoxY n=1 Tax=Undibacterium terreum TaxID=1224302 RepID=A0A916UTQ0_9BURK|nr:thiosulfate oxidation carrier protein SoxY [Undibacterium terreum]GGC87422.1 thiosulfate oxidation carrier protein SoxY [Undibacterium terreum]
MLDKSRRFHVLFGLVTIAGGLLAKLSYAAASRKAFEANSTAEALKNFSEKDVPEVSNRLLIGVPEISAEPDRIAVHLRSELPGTDMMLLMSANTVPPVLAQFTIPIGTEADISTQVKLKDTTTLQLVVRAGGKLYTAQKEVKIAVPLDNKLLTEYS